MVTRNLWQGSHETTQKMISPPLHNCLNSNVCVPTSTKCARMNMLAQRNEKVHLCTRIWWKAPNEHSCAPKCTVNEPKCVMAVIGVPRLGLVGSLPASTPPATLRSSRPPRLRDAIPDICHERGSCKFFLAGVNFYRFNAKNWQFTVYFAVIMQKIGNFLCILL